MRRILFYQVVYHVPLFIFLRAGFQTRSLIGSNYSNLDRSQSESTRLSFIEIFLQKRNSVWLLICIAPSLCRIYRYDITMTSLWKYYRYDVIMVVKKTFWKYNQRLKSEILALTESDWPPAVRGRGHLLCK